MKYIACYIRVSSLGNDQAKQRREINRWLKRNRFGARSVRWYIDKPKGKTTSREKFAELQNDIVDSKVRAVVLWRLDRLAETTREALDALIDWCDKSLRVVAVAQEIDFKSSECKLIASVLRGVIEIDRETRRERTMAGLAVARAEGRAGGRPRIAADEASVLKAKKLQQEGRLSVGEICKRLKISRSTYYRYINM